MTAKTTFQRTSSQGETSSRHRMSLWWLCWWAVLIAIPMMAPRDVASWGATAHRWINRGACQLLPDEMSGFHRWAELLAAHASDADARKSVDPLESPRHWIDIDTFPEFFKGGISHNLDSLLLRHGHHLDVYGNGVVPWVIAAVTETLSMAMAQGDWGQVLCRAADLGHYVADSYQPLHTTENYDGQLTGNDGIHLRYEVDMLERNLQQLDCPGAPATYLDDPLEHVFGAIGQTWSYVDSIMACDRQARQASPQYDEEYYGMLWRGTASFTLHQLCLATKTLADLWYTAWVDAGRPSFPPPPAAAPIAELESTPHLLELVTVRGVVTIGSGILDRDHAKIYLQDESKRGILLYHHEPLSGLSRGDLVQAEGVVYDHRGVTEMAGPSIEILQTECPLPPPLLLNTAQANDSRWESTLVQVSGRVVFTLESGRWTRLHLDDGSGAIAVLVYKDTGIDLSTFKEGHSITVRGVGGYLSDEATYVIIPGYNDDLILHQGRDQQNADP